MCECSFKSRSLLRSDDKPFAAHSGAQQRA
jgi:hypothetical protein